MSLQCVMTWVGACRGSWDKLGQVTTGPEETDTVGVPSNVFNGQTYDFVVPVELQGGPPNLKIAFNRDENPYDIADRCALPSACALRLVSNLF